MRALARFGTGDAAPSGITRFRVNIGPRFLSETQRFSTPLARSLRDDTQSAARLIVNGTRSKHRQHA